MCDRHLTDEERAQQPHGPAAFVDELVVALTNARIYAAEHPRLRTAVENLHEGLRHLLEDSNAPRVQLGAADGYVFFQARPLLGASMSAGRLIAILADIGAGGLSFESTTTSDEIEAFVDFTARKSRKVEDFKEANQALDGAHCGAIRFLPPYQEAVGGNKSWADKVERELGHEFDLDADLDLDLDLKIPTRLYQEVVGVLQDAMVQSCKGEDLDTAPALGHVESVLAQLSHDTTSMMRLARYEKYDEFTFGHSIRVCFIALNFARHLTNDHKLLERIGLAALMHDIGKAWVPFEVLHSRGRLDDAERREMNMHPVHGGHILLDSSAPDPLAVAVAFSHHQNMDGTGYPRTLRGGPASAATMIVKIADVYEALTAVRPYKPRMAPTRAYRIMMDMQGHFEPSMLRRFIECNGLYPVGTRLRLSTGEIARVEKLTSAALRPVVRTETSSDGERLAYADVQSLDLRDTFGSNRISVDKVLLDAEM